MGERIKEWCKKCGSFFQKIWNHKQGRVGLIFVLLLVFTAIFADVGVMVIAVLNAVRALSTKGL